MHRVLGGVLFLACAASLWPQTAPATPAPGESAAGLETEWDIAVVLREIGAHAARLVPAIEKIDVKSWTAKGASSTYEAQWQSSREQAQALADGTKLLARTPEKLSGELELYFRLQALDDMLVSLESGIRTYQDAAHAQELASLAAENGINRERLRQYIVNLAAQREREFDVMDREAQRCRAMMFSSTPPSSPGRKK
jgi:hypothetical protein